MWNLGGGKNPSHNLKVKGRLLGKRKEVRERADRVRVVIGHGNDPSVLCTHANMTHWNHRL